MNGARTPSCITCTRVGGAYSRSSNRRFGELGASHGAASAANAITASSDDAARYRDAKEYEAWKKKDPIERFQRYLQQKKLWNEAFEQEVQDSGKAALQAAVTKAEATGNPAPESLFDDVFMNQTPQLAEQRQQLLDLMAKGGVGADVGHFPL